MRRRFRRAAVTLAIGLSLAAATSATAGASPTDGEGSAVACPVSGQRFKKPDDPAIYLVDPLGYARFIPNATVYFDLWETYDGIITHPRPFIDCFVSSLPLGGAHLAKRINDERVYIWDSDGGGPNARYRWIISGDVFHHKYHFSPQEIVQLPSISPSGAPHWF